MLFDFNNEKPIYIQLAEWIEDAILSGVFPEEEQVPSTTEISVANKINPATALKGINLLVDGGIIYKKRGLGMFVKSGAKEMLAEKRKNEFSEKFLTGLVEEAKRLGLSKGDIIEMIERGFDK